LIGLAAYLALLVAAFATLLRGMRGAMPGLRGPPSADDRDRGQAVAATAARAAILACFIALLAHTMAYAGFLEDPLTWVLLSIGGSLALGAAPAPAVAETPGQREAVAPSPARAPA
jgi:putative inorganic carbon (HCO3(-)) transporter